MVRVVRKSPREKGRAPMTVGERVLPSRKEWGITPDNVERSQMKDFLLAF